MTRSVIVSMILLLLMVVSSPSFHSSTFVFAANAMPNDACVTLRVFDDINCRGTPHYQRSFSTTWSNQDGSSSSDCHHDANMRDFSTIEEYCNPATGNWHQTVILHDEHCQVSSRFALTEKLIYTHDNCLHGMQLASCRRGNCWQQDDSAAAAPYTNFHDEESILITHQQSH